MKHYYKLIFKALIILPCVIMVTFIHAQNATISGTISDTDLPLIGASIIVAGTTNGSTSDIDGSYSISVSPGTHVLAVSFIGYTEIERTVTVSAGEDLTVDFLLTEGLSIDEVVVLGSRAAARTKLETAVPVDVIDISKIASQGAQVNLNQILNYAAPSFTSNTQTISDGTDHIDPASLRGLGPDQVLVLINGKRRHTSSLVNVNGTFGRGSVGTDLNAIPAVSKYFEMVPQPNMAQTLSLE
jgi:iron complex outermembrane receptor protein